MNRAILVEPVKNVRVEVPGYELVHLWDSYADHPHPFDFNFQSALENRLNDVDFDPWDDYLVIAGHLATVSMAAAAIGRMFGTFRALVFDPREHKRRYEVVTFGDTIGADV